MELVSPKRNSICFTKTLWCEIPEVINSTVLSKSVIKYYITEQHNKTKTSIGTLNPYQKKLQEAKFEILTSEASYLNSLNVLNDHFITSFNLNSLITAEECNVLFAHVAAGMLEWKRFVQSVLIVSYFSTKFVRKTIARSGKMLARQYFTSRNLRYCPKARRRKL